MAEDVEYNRILTEAEFGEKDKFRRARKTRVVYDASKKIMGSISVSGLFDLLGNKVAEFDVKRTQTDGETEIEVSEYVGGGRRYTLRGDELYDGENAGPIGYVEKRVRNKFRIIVLSVLAALLTAAAVLIAITVLPSSDVSEPPSVVPVINISDKNGDWSEQGVIAVFSDGVKPGSSGKYEFMIANPHEVKMEYGFYIEPEYHGGADADFPLLFRLKMNNVPIESTQWKEVGQLRFDELTIEPESAQSFVLEWSWPFENGNDENDTLIGADGGSISLVLHLSAQAR